MTAEIDLLLMADREGHVVIHKDTNVLWSREELLEAHAEGQFAEDDWLRAPDPNSDITGPYPGCMQMSGLQPEWEYAQPVAQTAHFVIFALQEAWPVA
jgi:hypothetical protein